MVNASSNTTKSGLLSNVKADNGGVSNYSLLSHLSSAAIHHLSHRLRYPHPSQKISCEGAHQLSRRHLRCRIYAVICRPVTIQCRNALVDSKLSVKQRRAVDVQGDKNCFFHVVSVCLPGNEINYAALWHSFACHLKDHCNAIFGTAVNVRFSNVSLHKCAKKISKPGSWTNEDAILVTANLQ